MKTENKDLYLIQADICKALANAKRLEIIHLLTAAGSHYAAELLSETGLTKTNLSQHMRVLKQAGIVCFEREGTQIRYELASPKIGEACELLLEFLFKRLEQQIKLTGDRKRNV